MITKPDPNVRCPAQKNGRVPAHDVRQVGSFGRGLGYGYRCHTCWTDFTLCNGRLTLGHPEPAPYPEWDFDDD